MATGRIPLAARSRSAPPRRPPSIRNPNIPQHRKRDVSPRTQRMQDCRRAYGAPQFTRVGSKSQGQLPRGRRNSGAQPLRGYLPGRRDTDRRRRADSGRTGLRTVPRSKATHSLDSDRQPRSRAREKSSSSSLDAALHATVALLTSDPFHARPSWR